MDHKQLLRRQKLARRNNLSSEDRNLLSDKIFQQLKKLADFKNKECFFIYLHMRSEVETDPLVKYLLKKKRVVAVPVTDFIQRTMRAVEIKDLSHMRVGQYGIREPAYIEQNIDKMKIDCAIVPGAVFDKTGCRIGYGGGYYDRFFDGAHGALLKIGFAYDFQVEERIPQNEYDVPLDIIITDKGVWRR